MTIASSQRRLPTDCYDSGARMSLSMPPQQEVPVVAPGREEVLAAPFHGNPAWLWALTYLAG